VNILGTWTNKGPTMTRPKWSDESGQVGLQYIVYLCANVCCFKVSGGPKTAHFHA